MPMKIWPLRACTQSSFSSTSPIPSSGGTRHKDQPRRGPVGTPRNQQVPGGSPAPRTQMPHPDRGARRPQWTTHAQSRTHGHGANRHGRKNKERHSSVGRQPYGVATAPPLATASVPGLLGLTQDPVFGRVGGRGSGVRRALSPSVPAGSVTRPPVRLRWANALQLLLLCDFKESDFPCVTPWRSITGSQDTREEGQRQHWLTHENRRGLPVSPDSERRHGIPGPGLRPLCPPLGWPQGPRGALPLRPAPGRLRTVPSELQLLRRVLSLMGTVLGSSHTVKMLLWPGACTSSMHLPLSCEDRVQLMGL